MRHNNILLLVFLLVFFLMILWVVYPALRLLLRRVRAAGTLTEHRERDEGGVPWMATFQGIVHQLKQKEMVLAQMNDNILRSVTSGVISFDCEGKVTTVNPAAETILGLQQEIMLGADCKTLFGAHAPVSKYLAETLDQKQDVIREECEIGPNKWLGFTTSALRDSQGTVIGAIIVFVDLTEIKALQATVEIKKRFEIMGEISAWIAHELRNSMGTIMGYANLLSKEFIPNAPQIEMTRSITQECTTMDQLMTNLLAYGKKPVITREQTNLMSLMEEVREVHQSGAPQVQFITALETCNVAVDRLLIRQVLSNLIQNGIEAMGGIGTLTLRLTRDHGQSVKIEIADSGRGIPADQIGKIFLPFFTTREKGNGLGLAFVHKIVVAHNGTISVESREGKGTTFTITLPAHRF